MASDPVRETDRRNGHAARAVKQAERAADPRVIEDEDGNVHRTTSTTLVIPEEKRCEATTVRGTRCRVGRMRGLRFCVFHGHLAATDEALVSAVADERPRLSPRRALQRVVEQRADQLAEAAVGAALDAEGLSGTRAVLALVDAVDPLVSEGATLTLTEEGVKNATYTQLHAVYGTPQGA
jgi:hypothetical protein